MVDFCKHYERCERYKACDAEYRVLVCHGVNAKHCDEYKRLEPAPIAHPDHDDLHRLDTDYDLHRKD